MTAHVVILAQGVQSRLPDLTLPKQMLPLPACGNTPILWRTLRQVWEISHEVCTVVTWPPTVAEGPTSMGWHLVRGTGSPFFPRVTCLLVPGNSSLKGVSRYLDSGRIRGWDRESRPCEAADRTVVLLGDVVYSWACLRAILDPAPRVRFVGTAEISPSGGELWGIAWADNANDLMISSLATALKKHPPFDDTYQCGQLRRWMWAVHPELQKTDRYVAIDDYTDDVDLPEDVVLLPGLSLRARNDDEDNGVRWKPMCRFCGRELGFGSTMCGPCSDVP